MHNQKQNGHKNGKKDQPRVKWEPVKLFVSENSAKKLAVKVSKLPLFRPKFSVEVGVMLPPKVLSQENAQPQQEVAYDPNTWRFVTHFGFDFSTHNGQVYDNDGTGHDSVSSVIEALLNSARSWVKDQYQDMEDARIEEKQKREMRDINRNKPHTNVTGKTARKNGYVKPAPTAMPGEPETAS